MESPLACVPSRVAFVGQDAWLDGCAPPTQTRSVAPRRFTVLPHDAQGVTAVVDELRAFAPDVCVVFDPSAFSAELLDRLPGVTLGVLVDGEVTDRAQARRLAPLDRLVSFLPELTGSPVADKHVWRAVPAPVNDAFYSDVRELCGAPRAISIGASSRRREHMLLPAKHHHDLLQVLHGVSGPALGELLASCDVGVNVAARWEDGGYGPQVGLHLAAGQLLISDPIAPAHGLEADIDYLCFDSPEGLVWMLDRLGSFPTMYQRVRVRGRMKAEQYRASRVFARLTHDLLADVAAFG